MIKINNWASFQSYKDRKPPWIRLHKSILDNYEYHAMSANARALLPMLWLLASEDEDPVSGLIRYGYEKISFRLRLALKDIKSGIEELSKPNDDGESFIQIIPPCNETVTKQLQNSPESVTPETETYTETEKRREKTPAQKKRGRKMDDFSPSPEAIKIYDYYSNEIRKHSTSKARALKNIDRLLSNSTPPEILWECVNAYHDELEKNRTEEQYRKTCANFFGVDDPAYIGFIEDAKRRYEKYDKEKI